MGDNHLMMNRMTAHSCKNLIKLSLRPNQLFLKLIWKNYINYH